jgi:hypothetical protein
MEPSTDNLKTDLEKQLSELTSSIRETETKLMSFKEGYLKIQGALEVLEIIKQRQEMTKDMEALEAIE